MNNFLRNLQQFIGFCTALCAGAGWAASAQLSSCGGCGHLQWRLRLEEAGRSNHVEWNASLTYNKHSREILLILLDIFPMYVRVLIKHFSQKPSEAGVFYSTKFMIFLLDSLVTSTNKNKNCKNKMYLSSGNL